MKVTLRPAAFARVTLVLFSAVLLFLGAATSHANRVAGEPIGAGGQVFLPLVASQPAQPALSYHLVTGSATCVPNAGVAYYSGVVKDRAGALQNGVCVHVAFYGPRNTKCSGCDGVGDGNWGFAPYGGPAPENIPVEIFTVPCPAYMPPGGQSSDFGDLTPLSDKWLFTTTAVSMQCTGITFMQN